MKKEIGRHRSKNIFYKLKSNTAPSEPNGYTTARLEYPNVEEAEENDHISNFMKMIETFKEEMKKLP